MSDAPPFHGPTPENPFTEWECKCGAVFMFWSTEGSKHPKDCPGCGSVYDPALIVQHVYPNTRYI